eukprot:TRINITY_DN4136_c0_g3_i2.p1 TRINITY_DN4136_c0_g3~~TRINITY_DN4136_c0_g3_i2.p1  ORF type:complete len:744 (+),score=134.62 TRINITY_DN4136_c0_g3_i2:66-2297(+)
MANVSEEVVSDEQIKALDYLKTEVDATKIFILAVIENTCRRNSPQFSSSFAASLTQDVDADVRYILDKCATQGLEAKAEIVEVIRRASLCPNALYDFFSILSQIIAPETAELASSNYVQINPSSIIGDFVLKLLIGFHGLSFSKTCALCRDLKKICQDSVDGSLSTSYISQDEKTAQKRSKSLMALEAQALKQHQMLKEKIGLVPMREFSEVFSAPLDPVKCPLQLLENRIKVAMDARDWSCASITLYSYLERLDTSESSTNRTRPRLPEFLLRLATLHLHFGHLREALQALNESIVLSQQHLNKHCLTKALLYMARIAYITNQPGPQEYYLKLSQSISKKLEDPELIALSDLAIILYQLEMGIQVPKTPNGAQSQEAKYESMMQQLQDAERALRTNFLPQLHMVKSSLWEHLGVYALASSQLDSLKSVLMKDRDLSNAELVYSKISSLAALSGDWAIAADHLLDFNSQAECYHSRVVTITALEIFFEWSINRGEYQAGEMALYRLDILLSGKDDRRVEISQKLRWARLKTVTCNFSLAYEILAATLKTCEENQMHLLKIEALIAICDIHQRSGNPAEGLNVLMKAIVMSETLLAKPLELICVYKMIEIRFQLGDLSHANGLMDEYIDLLNERLPMSYRMQAKLLHAKILMLRAHTREELEIALDELQEAADGFERLQNRRRLCEALDLMANMAKKLQNNSLHDECNGRLLLAVRRDPLFFEESLDVKYESLRHLCFPSLELF